MRAIKFRQQPSEALGRRGAKMCVLKRIRFIAKRCKFESGLLTKKCKLFSGRVRISTTCETLVRIALGQDGLNIPFQKHCIE